MPASSTTAPKHRSIAATCVLLVVALVAGLFAAPSSAADPAPADPASPWAFERLSLTPSGDEPDGESSSPALSADGGHIVFETYASDLGTTPMPILAGPNIVALDLATGAVEKVSRDTNGGNLNYATDADISGNGRAVVMSAGISGSNRVIVRNRDAGTSTSVAPFAPARHPVISDSGHRVAMVQADVDIDDDDEREWVWVRDTVTGAVQQLVDLTGHADYSAHPAISGDGTTAAFDVMIGGLPSVHVVDVSDLSADLPPAEVIAGGRLPSLAPDGSLVAYARFDRTTRIDSIHVFDRLSGIDQVVVELPENANVEYVDLSADGETVAYIVQQSGPKEIWVSDVSSGRTEVVSEVGDSEQTIDIGSDGRTIVFSTSADGVVADDTNRMSDVFVARRTGASGPAWPVGAELAADAVGGSFLTVSWPAADDDLEVLNYFVRLDGTTVAQLPATARTHTITGLEPDTAYGVSVVAVDGNGNGSTPLAATLFTSPPAEPGSAPLIAVAGPGGAVTLQWDPAPDALGYRVLRATGEAELAPIAEVDADATDYVDAGLAADTDYRYAIDAITADGDVPHTVTEYVTTPALTVASANYVGRGVIDTPLMVTALGAPGWQGHLEVEHRSWYAEDGTLLDEPRAVTAVVPMAESATEPGRYVGAFTIDEGISEISAIAAVLGDGFGADARTVAPRLPLAVRGALRVDVDAPDGSIPGGRAVLDGGSQFRLDGGATWDITSVAPGTRTIRIFSARGTELGTIEVEAVAGRRTGATVTPALVAQLTARVVDADGSIIDGADVTFLDADGAVLGHKRTRADGLAALDTETLAGEVVEVQVQPPARRPLLSALATVTLEPGDNLAEIEVPNRPRGVLTGTVTLGEGVPAVGARVVLSQVDPAGQSWSFADVTDDDGEYEISGIAGDGTVAVSFQADPALDAGSVELDADPTVLDVTLERPDRYRVQLSILSRTADDPTWHPIDNINGTVAYQLGLGMFVGDRWFPVQGSSILVDGVAGDEVSVCARPWKAGMAATCWNAILGDQRVLTAELRLESVATVRGTVVGNNGLPIPLPTTVSAVLESLDQPDSVHSYRVLDGALDVPVARPGRYRITLLSADHNTGSPGPTARVDVELSPGEVLDVGAIVLSSSNWTRNSTMAPSRSTIVAGTDVELRAALRPNNPFSYSDLEARLAIPAGTALVEGSVLVDGVPVAASVAGGVLTVELGDRTWTLATPAIVVRYRLSTDGAAPGTVLLPAAQVASLWGSHEVAEAAAATAVRIAGVTLNAPDRSSTHDVLLSGQAPAGATVRVFDDTNPVGDAVASPGGYWRLAATLPDFGSGFEHPLVATTELEGEPLSSAVVDVLVDERLPVLEQVTFSQTGGRSVSFEPADGVARFPYVLAGGAFELDLQFGGRGAATNVRGVVGGASVPAANLGGGLFSATVPLVHQWLGSIDADYDVVPDMAGPADVSALTEAQVRSLVPTPLSDFGPTTVVADHDEANGIRRANITTAMPSLGEDAEMVSTLSVVGGLAYEPTSEDLATASATGVPFYGLSYSITATGNEMSVNVSGYMPEDFLGTAEEPAGFAAAAVATVARIGFQYAFTGAQSLDSLYTAATTGDKYDKLNNLLDWVNANCNDLGTSNFLVDQLNRLSYEAAATDALHAGLMVAGLAAAPATFGLGTLAVWAVTFAMDKALDAAMDHQISQVVDMAQAECRDDEDPDDDPWDPYDPDTDDDDPLGTPTWIYDPSGYVFEAVPSNRLEGVTATLAHSPTPEGPFTVWDAEWFGQSNPLTTDADGRYGWDVPEGFWQVAYTASGYEPAYSEVLEVLPPHFDVNVGMRSPAAPEVVAASAVTGARPTVTVRFDRYMRLDTTQHITVRNAAGLLVDGIVVGAETESGPDGAFARTFELVTLEPFAVGEVLTVEVAEAASSYADRPMLAPFLAEVTVFAPDDVAPTITATVSPEPGSSGWHTSPVSVALAAEDADGTVAEVRWELEGAQTGTGSAPGAFASVPVSVAGETTVRYTAVDAAGNESDEQTVVVRLDLSAPTASATVSPTPGSSGWHTGPVSVALSAGDELGGSGVAELRWVLGGAQVGSGSAAATASVPVTAPGTTTVRYTAVDVAGNALAEKTMVVRIDANAPTVAITAPTTGGRYRRGEVVTVDYACTDGGSGVARCTGTVADGAALPTSTVGTHTVTVTATDVAGNSGTASVTYQVVADDTPSPVARIDALVAKVRSFGLPRARTTALEAPLLVAKLGATVGSRLVACTSMVVFDLTVDTYTALRWITTAQARDLRTGSAAARSALGC